MGINKFNKEDPNIIIGSYLTGDNTIRENEEYAISGYIPVEPNEEYYYSPRPPAVRTVQYYDSDYNDLTLSVTPPYIAPSNAAYARFNFSYADLDEQMFFKADEEPSSYVPYKEEYDIENEEAYKSLPSIMGKFVTGEYTQLKLLGDSTVHGVGGSGYDETAAGGGVLIPGQTSRYTSPNSISWGNYLRDYMADKFGATVVNYGRSGASSVWILNNLDVLIEPEDDVVLISVGINDRITSTGSTIDYYNRLVTMANQIREMGKEVSFMAPQPVNLRNEESIPNDTYNFRMQDVANVVTAVNGEMNQDYVNMYNLINCYLEANEMSLSNILADQLHPNDTGYELIYKLFLHACGFADKPVGATWD